MPGYSVRARAPLGDPASLRILNDPDLVRPYLEDAAHFSGGCATEVAAAASEAAIARVLTSASRVLPVGAQSSLTGGATPMGDVILRTAALNQVEHLAADRVRVQAGISLDLLKQALAGAGRDYPPGPTFGGASVGGMVATNAAGAATFKYGATRDWVEALTVVLPEGDVLDLERGQVNAHPDGYFDLELRQRTVRVPIPGYHMPRVAKLSAGYYSAPHMDLVDLFVGSEGTLGVVSAVTLLILPERPARCLAFVTFTRRSDALALVQRLRAAAIETWRTGNAGGIDVAGIEHLDRRSLALLRRAGVDRANGVTLSNDAAIALLITLELPGAVRAEDAFDQIGRAGDPDAPDTPLVRFCSLLAEAGVLERAEIAVPGDHRRSAQLVALREAVPATVNQRVAEAKQADARIEKTAGDIVVPFEHVEEMLDFCQAEFDRRGLDAAVWGHVSDGNLHPNLLPRSYADVESGRDAILAIGREAMRLGGAPLAEHGVGRNSVKQQLLREMYGERGIEGMRRVKRAIDPGWKLAPVCSSLRREIGR